MPDGFRITLDPSAKQLRDDLWFGGSPPRVVRLTEAGQRAWAQLRHAPVDSAATGTLARRLTDAGLAQPEPPRTTAIDVTVVVPAFGRAESLERCLSALPDRHAVLVVDDGSPDPDVIAAVAARHGATVLRHDTNRGPAAARNTALRAVRTEFVAFLDSDCVPTADWIEDLAGHFADPLVAAVAPRIAPLADGSWSGRYTSARGSLDLGGAPARVAPGTRVGYVPTAALLVRHAALLDVGTFDETLRIGEDVDLVWRLNAAGWRVRYDPGAQVAHHEPSGWARLLARRFRYGTSAASLAQRHGNAVAPLVLHPWPTVCVAGVLARRPLVALAGFSAAVATMARGLRKADVPSTGLVPSMARAVQQTWLGLGRYTTQFAAPVLVAALLLRRTRWASAALLLGNPVTAWTGDHARLDPVRYTAGNLADEIAYGAGVVAGCLRHRTAVPLRPRSAR